MTAGSNTPPAGESSGATPPSEMPPSAQHGRGPAADPPVPAADDVDLAWPAPPRPVRQPRRTAATAAVVALGVAALGAPLGLLWGALAPSVPVRMTDGGAVLVEAQPEGFAAADGWFSLLGLAFGALVAVGAWLSVRRLRGPVLLLAVTLGTVGAALVAWGLGRRMGLADYERWLAEATVGEVAGRPADLRAAEVDLWLGFVPVVRGDVLLPALAAAAVYTLLSGWSRYATLRAHEEPDLVLPGLLPPEGGPHDPAQPAAAQDGPAQGGPLPEGGGGRSADARGAGGHAPRPGGGDHAATGRPVSSGWPASRDLPPAPAPPGRGGEEPSRG